jgi:hypothetical protein
MVCYVTSSFGICDFHPDLPLGPTNPNLLLLLLLLRDS